MLVTRRKDDGFSLSAISDLRLRGFSDLTLAEPSGLFFNLSGFGDCPFSTMSLLELGFCATSGSRFRFDRVFLSSSWLRSLRLLRGFSGLAVASLGSQGMSWFLSCSDLPDLVRGELRGFCLERLSTTQPRLKFASLDSWELTALQDTG